VLGLDQVAQGGDAARAENTREDVPQVEGADGGAGNLADLLEQIERLFMGLDALGSLLRALDVAELVERDRQGAQPMALAGIQPLDRAGEQARPRRPRRGPGGRRQAG
jgi:hypothetical protein